MIAVCPRDEGRRIKGKRDHGHTTLYSTSELVNADIKVDCNKAMPFVDAFALITCPH
jgi:hypothetical protein